MIHFLLFVNLLTSLLILDEFSDNYSGLKVRSDPKVPYIFDQRPLLFSMCCALENQAEINHPESMNNAKCTYMDEIKRFSSMK